MDGVRGSDLNRGEDPYVRAATTTIASPAPVYDDHETRPRWRLWPVFAMVAAGVVLGSFFAYSQIRPPIKFGYFSHPPLYGIWNPVLDALALTVIPAGLLLAAAGWAITSSKRLPSWFALVLVVGCGVVTAVSIALVRGQWRHLIRGVSTAPNAPCYTSDMHFVDEYGVRGFVERHAELIPAFHIYNAKTHPPGVFLFLHLMFKLFGDAHALRITTALAAIALSAAAAAWSMGRTLGGERSGRIAAVLFIAAPGPLLLAYTNMDGIFATVLATASALFMAAIQRLSVLAACIAGVVLGIGTLMTYATVFVAVAATVAVVVQTPARSALRLLGAAAAGGTATLVLARLVLGFDLLASYRAKPEVGRPFDPYWLFAHPAAWLIWCGLPLAALGLTGLVIRVPGARRAVLPLVLVIVMFVYCALPPEINGLRPGEVERTWAFLYPVLAAAAGPVVDRWTRGAGRWSGVIVAALVVISVAQTVLLQALWDNLL
jgi:hypothetical protein